MSEADAAAAADLLAALSIVRSSAPLEFAHPVVREAVYADIGPSARAQGHARAAALLAARNASEERIAAQIAASEPTGDSGRVDLLRRVAADALGRGAPAAASAWLCRALAEPPRPEDRAEVLIALGSAELRLGRTEAVDHLTEAVEQAREPAPLAAASRQLALALSVSGRADQAVELVESAITALEPVDRELSLLLEAELASHTLQASVETRAPAVRRLERHRDLGRATPGERLVSACLAVERAKRSGSATEAADRLEEALAGGRLLEEQQGDLIGPFYDLVIGLLATDSLDVVADAIDQALIHARARASIPGIAYLTSRRGRVSLRRGQVAQAEADARTALDLLTTYGIPLGTTFSLALLIEALIERDEAEAAERAVAESGLCPDMRPGLTNNFLSEALALLDLARGRIAEGVEGLVEFGRRDELWGGASPLASRWRSKAALGLAALGDADAASRMAAEDLEWAERWGAASGIGIALRAVGLTEGGEAGIQRLRQAAETLERSPARLEQARATTDLGAALRRANRRSEARGALRGALELAERCGGRALAARTRTELRAAGGPTSDPGARGSSSSPSPSAAWRTSPPRDGATPRSRRRCSSRARPWRPTSGGCTASSTSRAAVSSRTRSESRRRPPRPDQGAGSGSSPTRRPGAGPSVVAMRKLVTQTFVSLDGVMQAPGGPEEDRSGGFDHGGWSVEYWDGVMEESMGESMRPPFDLLLGRKTYEIFAAHWPHTDEPGADLLNDATKYVASTTLTSLAWSNSKLLEGGLADAVIRLKEQDGPELQVHGSWRLIQGLLAHDLVDEFRLVIFPVVLGTGKRLFGEGAIGAGLELAASKISTTGVIIASCRRAARCAGSFALEEAARALEAPAMTACLRGDPGHRAGVRAGGGRVLRLLHVRDACAEAPPCSRGRRSDAVDQPAGRHPGVHDGPVRDRARGARPYRLGRLHVGRASGRVDHRGGCALRPGHGRRDHGGQRPPEQPAREAGSRAGRDRHLARVGGQLDDLQPRPDAAALAAAGALTVALSG